jgi:hypothetical protein
MKALSLTIQKIWPMFKFLQTDKHTDRRTGQKLYAPDLSIQGHKNHLRSNNYEVCTHGAAVAHCFQTILNAIVLENINLSEDKIG